MSCDAERNPLTGDITAKSVSELRFQRGNIVNILNCAKPSERLKCCNKVHKKINSNTGGINDREKTR